LTSPAFSRRKGGVEDEIIDAPSPNFDERGQPVSMVVLHYTGMQDGESAIARLRDPEARVSSHYVIAEDGQILRLVAEDKRAWHAGESYWRGVHGVNAVSVGIEIVNPGHEYGYRPFTEQQMDALIPLLGGIVGRYRVPPANVVGHSDVAPARKQDPGELFDWARLARHHLAIPRPTQGLVDPHWTDGGFLLALERWGYDVREGEPATLAFQRRFRPELLDGAIDGECRAILLQLLLDRERGGAI
jgi:N-acetylmuramoyl-L-alanine amidase